jgi:sec-independent protein translocase protein TatA
VFTDILQPTHLLIILVVALVVLGPKRLPEAGRSLGKGLRDFKDALNGAHDEPPEVPPITTAVQTAPPAAPQAAAPPAPEPAPQPAPQDAVKPIG